MTHAMCTCRMGDGNTGHYEGTPTQDGVLEYQWVIRICISSYQYQCAGAMELKEACAPLWERQGMAAANKSDGRRFSSYMRLWIGIDFEHV